MLALQMYTPENSNSEPKNHQWIELRKIIFQPNLHDFGQ